LGYSKPHQQTQPASTPWFCHLTRTLERCQAQEPTSRHRQKASADGKNNKPYSGKYGAVGSGHGLASSFQSLHARGEITKRRQEREPSEASPERAASHRLPRQVTVRPPPQSVLALTGSAQAQPPPAALSSQGRDAAGNTVLPGPGAVTATL